MDKTDKVFKIIQSGAAANPNSFCYYGWEGTGAYAFWRYANAYYDSAEVLFEKFVNSPGQNSILDGLGITMCFLYRHFVELSIKYLYLKFVSSTDEGYKILFGKGRNLNELWQTVKPTLSALKQRMGSSIDIGVMEHYILEFDRFDKDSMTMRYPVRKTLKPMNGSTRLDIFNLHNRVQDLYMAFVGIVSDLENQMNYDVDQVRIDSFLAKYEELHPRIEWLLGAMKPFADKENKGFQVSNLLDSGLQSELGFEQMKLLQQCSDDEIIMLDTLYYAGRAVQTGALNLPKNPNEAKTDVVKMCIMNMDRDHLEFGKSKNDEICIYEKMASSIILFVSSAVDVIDRKKQ